MLWGLVLAILASVGLMAAAYVKTAVPEPNAQATAQTTVIYASDGHTRIASLGTDRTDVPLSQMPLDLRHAVLAAEDRHFYNEPAVSASGTLRALFTDLRGGDIQQGGSTITQQYVKNAYLTQQRTLSRKLNEILIAIKLGQERSKNQILEDYLNTIYFGRGAFGVAAAAKAYFREPLQKLTVSQDAMLAGLIEAPSQLDPRVDKSASQRRWQYVVNGMVSQGWLPRSKATGLRFPHTKPVPSQTGCTGNDCFIAQAVEAQLTKMGFTQQQIDQGGYKVITTINPTAQKAAVDAVQAAEQAGQLNEKTGQPETSVVSIKPGDGAIEAMYAGPGCRSRSKSTTKCIDTTGVTHLFDPSQTGYGRPPGSSMKPYTLIAALKQGISLNQTFNGAASIDFSGFTLHNAGGETCSSPCTLMTALAESINTVFVPLAAQVGPAKVADVAHDAGIEKQVKLPDNAEISLGPEPVPVVDQADGYATIAAKGVHATPYIVSKVVEPDGTVIRHHPQTNRVFSEPVASQAIYAMQQVLKCSPVQGTACGKELDGGARPAAGKTGTASNQQGSNTDAWFIGFTPQLATAVWVGKDKYGSVLSVGGLEIYGGQVPATIWQQTMQAALANAPIVQFPQPVGVTPPTSSPTPTGASSTSGSPSPTSSSPSPSPHSSSPKPTGSPTTSAPSSPPASSSSGQPLPTSSSASPGTTPRTRASRSPAATRRGAARHR
jgi:membrane peptidoglycan carboxypeptidase